MATGPGTHTLVVAAASSPPRRADPQQRMDLAAEQDGDADRAGRNAVVSTASVAYLASIAILLGGEVDALLRARRAARAELAAGDHQRMGPGAGEPP